MKQEEFQSEAADPLIGTRISGTYVLTRKIAEGGMGAVYLGEGFGGQRKVFKFLLPAFAQHPVIRERFEREALAAIRLNTPPNDSPHVVKIDDLVTLPDGRQCMQMEYLDGKTLETHLRQTGRLTPHRAFHLFIQIARGLSDLHRASIVHRDLKPGNIFLIRTKDHPWLVKLIDLGIAHDDTVSKDSSFRTQTGASMGTPGYMAVEQFIDAGNVTFSADLYALAIILWEMLTGTLPWGVHDLALLPSRQVNDSPRFPADVSVPPVWIDAMVASLSPRVQDRPPSLYELVAVLSMTLPADLQRDELSGTEMFIKFGMPMVREAPMDGSTVRAPNRDRVEALAWSPPRVTQLPLVPWTPPADVVGHSPTPVVPALAQPSSRPTANERPGSIDAPRVTTISSSVGVSIESPAVRRGGALGKALLGIGAATIAGVTTFAVIKRSSSSSSESEAASRHQMSTEPEPAEGSPVHPNVGPATATPPTPTPTPTPKIESPPSAPSITGHQPAQMPKTATTSSRPVAASTSASSGSNSAASAASHIRSSSSNPTTERATTSTKAPTSHSSPRPKTIPSMTPSDQRRAEAAKSGSASFDPDAVEN